MLIWSELVHNSLRMLLVWNSFCFSECQIYSLGRNSLIRKKVTRSFGYGTLYIIFQTIYGPNIEETKFFMELSFSECTKEKEVLTQENSVHAQAMVMIFYKLLLALKVHYGDNIL